jgi:hypothetical protein
MRERDPPRLGADRASGGADPLALPREGSGQEADDRVVDRLGALEQREMPRAVDPQELTVREAGR